MFTEINGIKDLLNSEGPILRILEDSDAELDKHNLYVEGVFKDDGSRILCKINTETLRMYLNGRLRTKELFFIRSEEEYITRKSNEFVNVRFSEDLRYRLNEELAFGNYFYTDMPQGMRSSANPSEIMKIVELFW
jgi:hypothetical protein